MARRRGRCFKFHAKADELVVCGMGMVSLLMFTVEDWFTSATWILVSSRSLGGEEGAFLLRLYNNIDGRREDQCSKISWLHKYCL